MDYDLLNGSHAPERIFALLSSNQSGLNGQSGKRKYMPTVLSSQQQSQEHNLNFPSSRSIYLCIPVVSWAKGTHADFLLCTSWDQSHDRSVYCKTVDHSLPKLNRFYKMEPKKNNPFEMVIVIASKNVSGLLLYSSRCAPDFHFVFLIRVQICLMQIAHNGEGSGFRQDASQMPAYELWIELPGMRTSMSNSKKWVFYLGESNLTLPLSPKHTSRAGFRAQSPETALHKGPAPLSSQRKRIMD